MKQRILEKATEMFLNIGFKSVTMDDISSDLGISKKTIYSHFKNKTTLVEDSTGYIFENISLGISKIRDQKKNPIEELFEVKQYVSESLKNDQNSPQYQLQKFFPKIHDKYRKKQLDMVKTCIEENILRGIDHQIYREDLSINFITRIYFTGITGIKDLEIFPIDIFEQSELVTHFLEYHIRAIATPKGLKILKTTLLKLN